MEEKSRDLFTKNNELETFAKKLKTTLALLSEIMSVAPNGILFCSDDFVILDVNPAIERKLGYSKSDIIGRRLDALLPDVMMRLTPGRTGEFFFEQVEAACANGETIPG